MTALHRLTTRVLSGSVLLFTLSIGLANPDFENFVRGDTNNDGSTDISDSMYLLSYLFGAGVAPDCLEACDINDDGSQDISDAIFMLAFLFSGGPAPPAPFPVCGPDPNEQFCPKSICNNL
ncbi:MAG TPA: dockerin type I domain-containing protein [Planctomycetota bacterium]|nr:dockerin type I domain-containing protein [Planctomycetota bacterium]